VGSAPDTISRTGWTPESGELRPDEEAALEEQVRRVQEEKRLALADPGLSWREWFLFRGAKWYLGLGYVIVLSWEALYLFPPPDVPGYVVVPPYVVVPLILLTLYGFVVLWQYLWFRPFGHVGSRSTRGPTSRNWLRPFAVGRWTPEMDDIRAGRRPVAAAEGPDAKEFL